MAPLVTLVRWCSTSAMIVFIRDSRYGMPAVQSVHLAGITVLMAAIVVGQGGTGRWGKKAGSMIVIHVPCSELAAMLALKSATSTWSCRWRAR